MQASGLAKRGFIERGKGRDRTCVGLRNGQKRWPPVAPADVRGRQEIRDLCSQEQEAGWKRYKYPSWSPEGPPVSPRGTSLGSIRPQHSLPPLVWPNDESDHPLGEDSDPHEVEPPPKEDEGLYIPSYLEEAIPDDPALQVKVARALRVQEMNSRRCFTCNRPGHLTRDHQEWEEKTGSGPSSRRGQLQTKRPQRRPGQNPFSPDGQGLPKSREGTVPEPGCFFQVHQSQELGPSFDQ